MMTWRFLSCYRECLEVKCRSASIPVDGEWDKLDRTGLCLNDKIVKVKITDTCAFFLSHMP